LGLHGRALRARDDDEDTMTEGKPRPRVLWTDLETTGLEPREGIILEIALIVTEPDLTEIARFQSVFRSPSWVRWFPMVPEVEAMHRASGLLDECERFEEGPAATWLRVADFLAEHAGALPPMIAGSSIHFDRAWLKEHAPWIVRGCHYRMLDVSGVRELLRATGRDAPERADKPHRAMPDIEASLALARWFAAGFRTAQFPEGAP
jgi:oligoribonuclease